MINEKINNIRRDLQQPVNDHPESQPESFFKYICHTNISGRVW